MTKQMIQCTSACDVAKNLQIHVSTGRSARGIVVLLSMPCEDDSHVFIGLLCQICSVQFRLSDGGTDVLTHTINHSVKYVESCTRC